MSSIRSTGKRFKGDLKGSTLNLIDLLLKIKQGLSSKEIYTMYGIKPQSLYYHLKRLKDANLILKIPSSYPAYYTLTSKGNGLLKDFRQGALETKNYIHLHHIQFSALLIKEGQIRPEKTWKANNCLNKFIKIPEGSIHWYGNTVSINIHSLFGIKPEELELKAKTIAIDVTNKLKDDFGFEIGVLGQTKPPHFEVIDPFTLSIGKILTMTTKDYDINDSWDMGAGVEFKSAEKAMKYLEMPERLENIERLFLQYAEQIALHLSVTKQIQDTYQKDQNIREQMVKSQERFNELLEEMNKKLERL